MADASSAAFVVDNSVVTGWWHPGQATEYSDQVLAIAFGAQVHVPVLWILEFANLLRRFRLERRINDAQLERILANIEDMPLIVDIAAPDARKLVSLSFRYALTAYDAAYLELALRLGVPLACKDGPLAKAAKRSGIGLYEPSPELY